MISGKAKILTGEKKKQTKQSCGKQRNHSSKVPTLSPKPNTLLGIYRENLFPQQPSTVKFIPLLLFVQTLSGNSFTGNDREGNWKKVPSFFPTFSPSPSPSAVRHQALPGGRCHTVLVSKGSQDSGTHSGRVSLVWPGACPTTRPFCEGCYAHSLSPASAGPQSPSQKKG